MKIFLIYIKSLLDFILLLISRNNISEIKNETNNLLFINTGQIGDLVISAALLEEDERFDGYSNVFFLIQKQFEELYKDYKGRIKIIIIDIDAYKYNIIYRFKFNNYLRKLNIDIVYNLTSIRPTWNDALALGIGANKTFCYPNNWLTLKKVFPETTDALYTKQIATEFFNEYEKINYVLYLINAIGTKEKNKSIGSLKYFPNEIFDIVINPFSSQQNRDITIDNLNVLAKKYINRKILILCSKEQKTLLENIRHSDKITFAAGKYKLNQLFSVINNSKVFIGVDSGLTHIALTTKTNVVAVIGKGNYGRYLPKPDDNNSVYLFEECEFTGCEWYCKKDDVFCVKNITVNKIINAVDKFLIKYENT